jgi:glutamate carboxypeptidase
MKGGAHLAFAAYRSICEAGKKTPLPIRFLYSSDEEAGSQTSRALIEAEAKNAKYVLVTEPARHGGKVVTGRKGVGQYVIKARGRPAHAGGWHHDGRSAVVEVARHVIALEGMTDYARGITMNVGRIKGGTADNVVPEHCSATIDMRIATMADAKEMDARLRSLKSYNPDVSVEITGSLNRPPFEKNAGIERLLRHAKKLAKEIGFDLGETQTGGGSDGNFTAHKVPTLDGLGVDGDGAHTLHEHLFVSSILPRMMLQKRLFETLQ